MKNLVWNGLGIFNYFPRPNGRMASLSVWYHDGKYDGSKGVSVRLQIVDRNPDGHSHTIRGGDPSLNLLVFPLKRYSKKHFIEVLERLDPHVPELAATYEHNQGQGAQKLQELLPQL